MKKIYFFISLIFLNIIIVNAQAPDPALIGYWHNWNTSRAPFIELDQVDSRYNVICIAFAVPDAGTDYDMIFSPRSGNSTFISQIQTLQSQGKKVLISLGGGGTPVSLTNTFERNTFVTSVLGLIDTYGFDGFDIDFEGSSLNIGGGTISNPTDRPVINLIAAVRSIMQQHRARTGQRLILSMAPETAHVQGGQTAYRSFWGAYLPVIDALRDSIEYLHVQLYNSGTMYGIDGNIYSVGTPEFIVAMTEATIQGFATDGGAFAGIDENKIVIGLPACPSASGSGYLDTAIVRRAVQYLLGGRRTGSYQLQKAGGYPLLRGMMTWSINWDKSDSCASEYAYATNYERIFGSFFPAALDEKIAADDWTVYPNPADDRVRIKLNQTGRIDDIAIYNFAGQRMHTSVISENELDVSSLASGLYLVRIRIGDEVAQRKLVVRR